MTVRSTKDSVQRTTCPSNRRTVKRSNISIPLTVDFEYDSTSYSINTTHPQQYTPCSNSITSPTAATTVTGTRPLSLCSKMLLIISILLMTVAIVTPTTSMIPSKLELNNNNNNSTPEQIGDQQRSNTSSSLFFQSVDRDGDGLLERFELAHFLKEIIGGSSFDDEEEVDQGVKDVMDKLDIGGDDGLDVEDVLNHWNNLEKLLGVEETAEWIEHAVQMPEDVVRKFQQNGVTGFDFPELVEDNGKLIAEDLEITSDRLRQKIVRLIRARMIGIGSEPTTPSKVTVTVQDCSVITLDWEPSVADSFPVHKYRVQRRIMDAVETNGNFNNGSKSEDVDSGSSSVESINDVLDWETIHANSKTTKMDTVFPAYKYSYRIEAWNAVGRSEWHVVDVEKYRKKNKCKARPGFSMGRTSRNGSNGGGDSDDSVRNLQSIITVVSLAFTVISYILSQILHFWQLYKRQQRLKNDNGDESTCAVANLFTRFQHFVNKYSVALIGFEIFPSDAQSYNTYGMEHVDGFDRINKDRRAPMPSHQRPQRRASIGSGIISENTLTICTPCTNIHSTNESPDLSERTERSIPKKPRRFRPKKNTKKYFKKLTSSFGSDSAGSVSSVTINTQTTVARTALLRRPSEDVRSCAFCRKKYGKIKHVRHDCARCGRTFCHSCGHTTHPNIFPCQVPGSCLCPNCKHT